MRNNGTRGRYVMCDVVQSYLNYLKKSKRGTVRQKLFRQQERKLKIENERQAATLVPINEAAEVFLIGCCLWRAGAEAIPKSLADRIAKTKNEKEIRDILDEAFAGLIPEIQTPIDEFVGNALTTRAT